MTTAQEPKTIDFNERIESSLPPEVLWAELKSAFVDSSASRIWPQGLETVKTDQLRVGAEVRAVYHVPFWPDAKCRYLISELDDVSRKLAYQADVGHPFKGGATVVLKKSGSGSVLIWRGQYRYEGFSAAAWFFKLYFGKRFFRELKENIMRVKG